jgi:hypothetical protein
MRISQAQIAIIFTHDKDIVFTIADSLKKLQARYKGNIQMLNNIPDFTPPNAPRIVFTCPNFALNVALMRFDIFINPPEHICSDSENVLAYLQSLISSIDELLIVNRVKYEWSGLVLTVEIPKSTKSNIRAIQFLNPVFDQLTNIKRNGKELASFSFQYGILEDSYFVNYTINGYEKLDIPVQNLIQIPPDLKAINPEISESGIAITLDINNQPLKVKKSFNEDIAAIFSKSAEKLPAVFRDTGLEGLI